MTLDTRENFYFKPFMDMTPASFEAAKRNLQSYFKRMSLLSTADSDILMQNTSNPYCNAELMMWWGVLETAVEDGYGPVVTGLHGTLQPCIDCHMETRCRCRSFAFHWSDLEPVPDRPDAYTVKQRNRIWESGWTSHKISFSLNVPWVSELAEGYWRWKLPERSCPDCHSIRECARVFLKGEDGRLDAVLEHIPDLEKKDFLQALGQAFPESVVDTRPTRSVPKYESLEAYVRGRNGVGAS